jgi:hypothetical protein
MIANLPSLGYCRFGILRNRVSFSLTSDKIAFPGRETRFLNPGKLMIANLPSLSY